MHTQHGIPKGGSKQGLPQPIPECLKEMYHIQIQTMVEEFTSRLGLKLLISCIKEGNGNVQHPIGAAEYASFFMKDHSCLSLFE